MKEKMSASIILVAKGGQLISTAVVEMTPERKKDGCFYLYVDPVMFCPGMTGRESVKVSHAVIHVGGGGSHIRLHGRKPNIYPGNTVTLDWCGCPALVVAAADAKELGLA